MAQFVHRPGVLALDFQLFYREHRHSSVPELRLEEDDSAHWRFRAEALAVHAVAVIIATVTNDIAFVIGIAGSLVVPVLMMSLPAFFYFQVFPWREGAPRPQFAVSAAVILGLSVLVSAGGLYATLMTL